MTEDVKPEIIKRTQDLLGKYFKKPPLTEKLLRKPPFRFLHDIISAIIKETGFLNGLFTEEELNSDNIKDKEAKLAYLTKLIDVVKLITGTNLTVRASKIIAGHEPTKTNELLHAIGRALDKKVSSVEAIEHYKKSCEKKARTHTKPKPSTKEDPIKKPASRHSSQTRKVNEKEKVLTEAKKRSPSTEKTASREVKTREDDKREKKRLQEKENERKVDIPVQDTAVTNVLPSEQPVTEEPPSSMRQKRQQSSVKSKQNVTSPKSSDAAKIKSALLDATNSPTHKPKEAEAQKSSSGTRRSSSGHHQQTKLQQKEKVKDSEDASSLEQKSRLSTAKETREKGIAPEDISKKEKNNDAGFSENTKHIEKQESAKSERKLSITNKQNSFDHPGSPPPRPMGTVSNNSEETANIPTVPIRPRTSLRPPSVRPISARPAAPRMKSKTEYIVNEDISTPMGNVNVIVENYDTKEDDADDMVVMETGSGGGDSLGIERPIHTDSQLPSEHGHLVAQILETQRELVNTDNVDVMPKKVEIEWEAGSRRDREVTVKEVDKLRGAIQTLTRATNPLGKLLDYLQEDVEMMQRELQEWRSQYNCLSKELEKEQVETQESIEPMKETLKDIEDLIKQELDKICQMKSNIMKNGQKMQRLLNGHL